MWKLFKNKNTWEIYIFFEKSIGMWIYLAIAIWQYVGQHEWGKPLNQIMMDYSIPKLVFLSSVLNF